jgi:hypothetical protein
MTGDERFDGALGDALQLVHIVHGDGSQDEVAAVLARADIPALCVVLAALVPDPASERELLAWNDRGIDLGEFHRLRAESVSIPAAAVLAGSQLGRPA